MFCIKCGQELTNGTKFCTKCGTPVQHREVVAPEVSPRIRYKPQISITSLKLYKPFKTLAIIAPILYFVYLLIAIFVYDFEGAFNYDYMLYSQESISAIEWISGVLLYGFSVTFLLIKLKIAFYQKKYGIIVFSIIGVLFCIIAIFISFGNFDKIFPELFPAFLCPFFIIYSFVLSIFELIWAIRKK
jgi:hypothetical protein